MYYTQEQIDRANQADLVSFLQSQGEQLTRAGNEYRWKRHDSLTVRGNKWYRHSQSKGGGPVDFIMEFFGKSFTEAVELLTGEKGAAPPPDRCALPGFVDSKNEEKTERNAGYLVVSHSGGGMLRQGTRKGIRRTPANRGMRAHWVVKGLDISEDVCHGMCP